MSGKCDFCSAPDPEWIYPSHDFKMTEAAWGSVGAWAACNTCSELIEANDREALARRGMATQAALVAILTRAERELVKAEVLKLHDTFYAQRKLPRMAFG